MKHPIRGALSVVGVVFVIGAGWLALAAREVQGGSGWFDNMIARVMWLLSGVAALIALVVIVGIAGHKRGRESDVPEGIAPSMRDSEEP